MSVSFNPDGDALVVSLIRQHMVRGGIDRKALGHLLANGKNATKAFRRLDELLRGEEFRPEFVQRVVELLQIPPEQLAVARETQEGQAEEQRLSAAQRAAQETMKRRGPHLWGILPENYHPSLITILGPEFFLLFRLPEEFADLPHYEMTIAVGEAIREHYQNHRRCRLIGYEFRQSLADVFRFDTLGEYMGRAEESATGGRSEIRVGNRTCDRLRILGL